MDPRATSGLHGTALGAQVSPITDQDTNVTTATTATTEPAADRASPLHALSAFVWAASAAAAVQIAPSPVYVALVVGISALVVEGLAGSSPFRRAFPALIALGVVFSLIRIVLTALTTHGTGHVLFTLPQWTLPNVLGGFTVGGTIELGVILQTAAEGFALIGVMAAFGAFNAIVSHYELTQSMPRAFFELGLVVTIALAFVPATLTSIRRVRDADVARTGGVAPRRGRLLRQLVPVLELGLERAVALSESMDARGYAAATPGVGVVAAGWATLVALLALAGTFVALIGEEGRAAAFCALVGLVALVVAVVSSSRATRRSRYRPRAIGGFDRLVMAVSIAAPVGLAVLSARGDTSLVWSAIPLAWPTVHLLPTLCVLLLAVPLLALDRTPR